LTRNTVAFLLGASDAALQGGGQGGAEQGAALGQGELLAGSQDGAVGGVLGHLAELGDVGDSLLQGETLGVVTVFDRQTGHRRTS
jgi:hypothetical protein